jgi:hypothetical protein
MRYRRSRTDYPAGVLSIYDNEGKTSDRYLVVYEPYEAAGDQYFPTTCMGPTPYSPQGICMHDSLRWRPTGGWGSSLVGKVIAFDDLPADCQRVVRQDLEEEI